jgi:hypothetical protein
MKLAVERALDEKEYVPRYDSTRVEFRVALPGRQLLGVDPGSRVAEFGDDRGNSLIDPKSATPVRFTPYPRVAKDRGSMLVEVVSVTRAPARGATRVLLKGDLVVRCGTDETTAEAVATLADKAETNLGGLTLRVMKGKGASGGPDIELVGAFREVKAIAAADDEGKAVELLVANSADLKAGLRTQHYQLRRPLPRVKVRVTYFAAEEKVTIPVDLAFGPGL